MNRIGDFRLHRSTLRTVDCSAITAPPFPSTEGLETVAAIIGGPERAQRGQDNRGHHREDREFAAQTNPFCGTHHASALFATALGTFTCPTRHLARLGHLPLFNSLRVSTSRTVRLPSASRDRVGRREATWETVIHQSD